MDKNPYEPPLARSESEAPSPDDTPRAMLRHEYVTVGCLVVVVLLLLIVFVGSFVVGVAPL